MKINVSPPALKDITTTLEFAVCVILLVRTVLVPPLTNVLPVMKPDHFFIRIALVLKNAQILLTLTLINSSVTLAITLAKHVQGLTHHNAHLVWIIL